jgi:hypothetical protein
MRDITLAETIYPKFTTRAFASGIPAVLAGTPVISAYENDSVTQITAGITLGVDHDSVVGLNMITVVATGANGFEAGKEYQLVITTGTVGGVSVVGEIVGEFTIDSSAALKAVDLLNDVAATDIVSAGAITTSSGAVSSVTTVATTTTNSDMRGTDSALLAASINLTAGAVDNVTLVATTTTNTDMRGTDSAATASALATVDSNVDAILVDTGTTIPAQISGLNDVAATDIVSSGAITTSGGAVSTVTTVGTTTTNTDMRGTDSAATAANLATVDTNVDAILVDTGTTIPASISGLNDVAATDIVSSGAITTSGGAVSTVTTVGTTTTNTDMRGTDSAATAANLATVDTNVDAILVDTSTTLPGLIDDLAIKKNTAFSNFEFLMVLTSDHVTPATGKTVTGQRSIDGGAFAGVTGTIAEVSNGIYQFDALAADTNGDVITWRFSEGSSDDTFVTFKTVA